MENERLIKAWDKKLQECSGQIHTYLMFELENFTRQYSEYKDTISIQDIPDMSGHDLVNMIGKLNHAMTWYGCYFNTTNTTMNLKWDFNHQEHEHDLLITVEERRWKPGRLQLFEGFFEDVFVI